MSALASLKHAMTFTGAIVAAIVCAATGAYVLRHFNSTAGLIGGAALVLLGVGIALPVQLREGATALRNNVVLVVPVVVDALRGGNRRTDPPNEASVAGALPRPFSPGDDEMTLPPPTSPPSPPEAS